MIRIALLTLLLALPSVSYAQDLSAGQKTEIEALVKQAILDNPELILKSVEDFQLKQQKEAQKEQAKGTQKFLDEIGDSKAAFTVGNPKGDVTVVEFFDYNCGYCKKAFEDIQALLKDDKNIKIILFDMPVLGPASEEASKWSIAAAKQGKYFDFHREIITHQGQKDEAALEKLAKKVGLDVKQLKKDAADPETQKAIDQNIEQAQSMGFSGTPGFIVGTEMVRGYIGTKAMKEMVAKIRKEAAGGDAKEGAGE